MAKPQLEDGFTRIAHEILEALAKIRTPGEARQIVDVVIRKTYGFGKKEDNISLSQFCLKTGMKKPTCCRAIKKAVDMNIIIKKDNGYIATYRFNKDFDTWRPLSKKITVIKKDNLPLSFSDTTIDILTIDTSCTNSKELSALLASLILQNSPSYRFLNNGKYDATLSSWAKDIDRMVRLDKRPVEEIERIIRWCQADKFWRSNILSGAKLREKYDQLAMKATDKDEPRDAAGQKLERL